MDMSIEIQYIGFLIISIFIGYVYHYLKTTGYKSVLSLNSLIVGTITGFLISVVAIVVSLINTPLWSVSGLLTSSILVIYSIILSIGFVVIGGIMAVTIKRIINGLKSNRRKY